MNVAAQVRRISPWLVRSAVVLEVAGGRGLRSSVRAMHEEYTGGRRRGPAGVLR